MEYNDCTKDSYMWGHPLTSACIKIVYLIMTQCIAMEKIY